MISTDVVIIGFLALGPLYALATVAALAAFSGRRRASRHL